MEEPPKKKRGKKEECMQISDKFLEPFSVSFVFILQSLTGSTRIAFDVSNYVAEHWCMLLNE